MDRINIMQKLGLTETEAKVYLELLKLGSTTTGPLVKKSELHRATVYDILKRLMEKGLVNYITKQKTRYFQATNPNRFLDFVFEEEQKLKQKKQSTEDLVKELEKIKESALSKQEAHIFVGKKAVKSIYEMVLRYKENWVFGSHGRFRQTLGSPVSKKKKEIEDQNKANSF
ncbi:helix-turn-helix domain-containing protein [Candidatus Woesearchaeota archaeon]|nr:helix-turn-helix domain-containing protein [Candidatus Woesearchaeota archaeon]